MAAFLSARDGRGGEIIDCSLMEACHLSASGFIDLYYALAGSPPVSAPPRLTELPSIEPTADGWVGFNTNTHQQFESFLVMIGRADLLEQDAAWALAPTRYERMEQWNKIVRDWTTQRTTAEIVEVASALRIPVAHVNNGRTVLDHPHFNARGVWAASADGSFTHPLPPYRIDGTRPGGEPKIAPTARRARCAALSRGRRHARNFGVSRECLWPIYGSSTPPRGGLGLRPPTSSPRWVPTSFTWSPFSIQTAHG